MKPSGVITFTTDFGHKGPFAGVMKGVILSRMPSAVIVDLAHDIPAQWPPEAGFWVSRAYRYFPRGTVHVAIVDPGVGTERDILLVEYDGHCFIAPDNGLLGQLLDEAREARVWHLDPARLDTLRIETPSYTFHGRDIFAPVAAEIAAGNVTPDRLGQTTSDWVPAWLDGPCADDGRVAGVVITVDTFGNLISDIDETLVARFGEPVVHLAGHQLGMQTTYASVSPGDYLALVNSFGVIEIAKAEGNAAESLGTGRGAPVIVSDGYSV